MLGVFPSEDGADLRPLVWKKSPASLGFCKSSSGLHQLPINSQFSPHTDTMVTKSKLKMALVAEKGTDFKKLNQKKQQKAARKEKATKGGAKKTDEDWESLDGVSDEEDGGAAIEEDEADSGSEDEVEEPMQVCHAPCCKPIAKPL